MKDMRASAKSSQSAKLSRMTGGNPIAKAATAYATNTSGQNSEKQTVPTRATGGMVTADSMGDGYARGGMPDRAMNRQDRPSRVSVIAGRGPIENTGIMGGGGMAGRMPMPGAGGMGGGMGAPPPPPIMAPPTPLPPRPGAGMGGGGGMGIPMGGGAGAGNPGPMGPMGGGQGIPMGGGMGNPGPMGPGGPMGMGMNPMMRGGFKRGGAVKSAFPAGMSTKPGPGEKNSAPVMPLDKPQPAAPKGFGAQPKDGAGGGLGRMQKAKAAK